MTGTIAALFVQRSGCYFGLPDVDPWDEARDARKYAGPWPVVAHPPCARWCRLAGLVEKTRGYKRGEDGGCFAAALGAVRKWGGVLEHPMASYAWAAFGLPRPPSAGGWIRTFCGGWTCQVEQFHYGHAARKETWLYVSGLLPPPLIWGPPPGDVATAYVTDGGGDVKRRHARRPALVSRFERRRLGKKEALATPLPFRDLLIGMARSVHASDRRVAHSSEFQLDQLPEPRPPAEAP